MATFAPAIKPKGVSLNTSTNRSISEVIKAHVLRKTAYRTAYYIGGETEKK